MSTNGDLGHDSVSVMKKSSSLPSTPQTSSFPDSLPSAKRRRTQKSLNGDDQIIQMNGHKNEGSNFGYIVDGSFATTVSDGNDRREPLPAEGATVVDGGLKAIKDTGDVASSKVARGSRASNETSRRILKLKTGTGTSQQTIQTFIFKASHPRGSLTARNAVDSSTAKTSGPSTPFSGKDAKSGSTQTVRSEPGNHVAALDGGHSKRGGRKSTMMGTDGKKGSTKTIKFKNYFQTPTPNDRSARKSARIDKRQDSATSLTTPQGATPDRSIPQSQSGSNILMESENAGSQLPGFDKQTESTLHTPTSNPVRSENAIAPAGSSSSGGPEMNVASTNDSSSNSVQRRSSRIRKSVGNGFLGDVTKQEETSSSAKRSVPDKPKSAVKGRRLTKDTGSSGVSTPHSMNSPLHSTPPKTPVPAIGSSQDSGENNGNDGQVSSKQRETPTPSPESLLTTARISGRLRKPTIQAIEALQQKPKTRKRKLDSDQSQPLTTESNGSPVEGQQSQDTSVSATPIQQSDSASTPGPSESALPNGESVQQSSKSEEELLGQRLYELACAAVSDSGQDDEDINLDQLREEFHASRQKTDQAASTASEVASEVPSNPTQTEQTSTEQTPKDQRPTEQDQTEQPSTEQPHTEQPHTDQTHTDQTPRDQSPTEQPPVEKPPPEQPVLGTSANLDHPNQPRPWTDSDGWTHTGRVNEYGEEIVLVPDTYVWVRQMVNYGNSCIPPPPPLVKSRQQVERDQIFGFPPLLGQRNLPRMGPRRFVPEDVSTETAKIKAREAAAQKGLSINRSMSLTDIEAKIREHDHPGSSKTKRLGLKLVLVDSRQLTQGNVNLRSEGLRKRRQSAPAAVEENKRDNATSRPRKRQLDEGRSGQPSPADLPPSKKRRSTLNPIDNSEVKTPSRQKKQSLGKANYNAVQRVVKTPASTKTTPKQRRHSAVRAVQSEKISKTKAAGFTPASGRKSGADRVRAGESPSTQGRPRRQAAAALMAQFKSQPGSKARRASTGIKHSKSTPNKRQSKGNPDTGEASNARTA
ncbi:hypothetical protein VTN77DRAFT_4592 [Rasamsonia byssochlamydoides]|uniref:uncharacterized protein n=1 Tax=Rasamsonia byssochlamydoides TaxID=89139 RepID=UPI00374292EC